MSRKQLDNFLEQVKIFTLGSSITKFVIEGTPMQATKKGGNSNGNTVHRKDGADQKEKSHRAEGPEKIEAQTKDESGARDGPH